MKKKIFLSILTLFVFAVLMISVNAAVTHETPLGVGYDTKAKTPEVVPNVGDIMYGTVTDNFKLAEGKDFSKIIFTTPTGTENGKTDARKIIVGKLDLVKLNNPETTLSLGNAFSKWFTAYCLDGTLKYPENGIYSSTQYLRAYAAYEQAKAASDVAGMQTAGVGLMDAIVTAAISNDPKVQKVIKSEAYGYTDAFEFSMANADYTVSDSTDPTQIAQDVASILTAFSTSKTPFTAKIYKMTLTNISATPVQKVITGAMINSANSISTENPYYEITVSPLNIIFDKYTVNDKTNSVDTNSVEYTKALWIIEHTYPSLDIETALAAAEADYDTLKSQIATIYSLTDATEIEVATENVVYQTIQNAIWTVTGTKNYTGVQNSTELNKLFTYLIGNRTIPSDYATGMSFANKVVVSVPEEGKELYKKTDSVYTYGPYSATYDALDGESLTLSVTTEDADGVKTVDADGNEVTEVQKGQDFFVQVPLKAKLGNVTIKVAAKIKKFTPDGLRGRIYQPVAILGQNVMSGGKIENATIDTTFDIVVNAKTGVENVAILLMVTLVAFSLGYLILSYRNKSVELS